MSSSKGETDYQNGERKDRAVTDSVHARFRSPLVYCDICKLEFDGNSESISKHFNGDHPSTKECLYCHGKVFEYERKIIDDENNSNFTKQTFIYHDCRNSVS